ncbi:MAG: hypothetical protein QW292_04660 [Candidatus Parvarchaeota archaeon]
MKVVVRRKNGSIEAAITSDSFFQQKDPQVALAKLKEWESKYRNLIHRGKRIVDNIRASKDNLVLRWELGELLHHFLTTNTEFEFDDYEQSLARDLELPPTEKTKTEYATSDVSALLGLRKIFPNREAIDPRITWNLVYYTHEIMASAGIEGKDASKVNSEIVNELLEVANHQAKLGTKGNGAAKGVARKLVQILTKHKLL